MIALPRRTHALLVTVLALPSAVRAAPCAIEAAGAADGGWAEATASLRELELRDDDCVSLRIDRVGGRTRVLFTTRDDRTAERFVDSPEELKPTVEALRVQAPIPRVEPAPSNATDAAQLGPAKPAPDKAADERVPLRFVLLTGARGGADSLVSPLLTAGLALSGRSLELGATLSSELQYFELEGQRPADRQGSAAAIGLQAGVRAPWGGVDVLAGGRAALALMLTRDRETGSCTPDSAPCPRSDVDERTTEWRFGAYAGLAAPRGGSLRFRGELGAELATPAHAAGSLPLTPSWALCALLGIEVEP